MRNLLCFAVLVLGLTAAVSSPAAEGGPVYELRVYTTNPGKMPDLLKRFREHTWAIFEKHGMVNIGYWQSTDPKLADKLFYVLQFPSREAAKASWKAFGADPEWQAVQKASEANGAIVTHVDSTFLAATDYSPALPKLTGRHVFELRTYTANDGKLDALDARFREHTMAIFARVGMTNVAYWHPLDADKGAGKTLVYILAHANAEAARKSWDDFRADAEWQKVKAESEKNGALLVHAPDSIYLIPTDFSPLQ